MRVDPASRGRESVETGKPERARPAPSPIEHGSETAVPDQTSFSFNQSRVQLLTTQVLAQPEVRQQRVDLLRQALGKGEYSVSDTQIADAIVADVTSSAGQATG